MKITVRRLVLAAMIAAVYAALTLSLAPIGYGLVQLRLSEALCVLPYLFPAAAPGLFIGCMIANIISPYGIMDMAFGSLATLLAAVCTMLIGRKKGGVGRMALGCLPPVLFNAVFIGAIQAVSAAQQGSFVLLFCLDAGRIALSEAAVMYIVGLPLLVWFPKTGLFRQLSERLDR